MDLFTKLFGDLLVFVYHCFDRIVIHGYLSGLSRPEQVVYFFRHIVGAPVVSKELLSQRTADYRKWVEAFVRNHHIPIEWAEKGVRKEDFVQPWLRLKRQGQLICIERLRSFSAPQGCQEFANVVLQQHPRRIRTDLGCRQTLLADHAQHGRICDTQKRRHFTDGQLTSSFPFSFAVNFDRVVIAH
jgi:hypothetical protein